MRTLFFFLFLTVCLYLFVSVDKSSETKVKINQSNKTPFLVNKSSAFPYEQRSPGGLIKLRFKHRPEFFLNDMKIDVFMMKENEGWLVLMPFSIYKEARTLRYTSKTSSIYQLHLIKLEEAHYPKQYINVKNKEFVSASKRTLKRIEKEYLLKKKLLSRVSKIYINNLKMIRPLDSQLRHDFGRRRYFNGVAKSPHGGIDLSGKKGDKIRAPLSGEVFILRDLFYNGNFMVIDHGQGLMTAYSHLSKFLKKEGDWVKQGEFIAEVGATGRATGPHLHWSVYLGGEPVNPDLFLDFRKTPTLEISKKSKTNS